MPTPREDLLLLEQLRQDEKEALRIAAKLSTYIMACDVLWPTVAHQHYDQNSHKPVCDWLDSTPRGAKRAVACHRQYRKSMLLNIARCVRLIVADPNIRIMLISAYQRTAIDMCGLIKRQFQTNDSFRAIFPEFAVDDLKWGKIDEFTHPERKVQSYLDPTLFATYLGAPLISKRADVIVLDDPVDEDMVSNPDMAQATMNKFTQVIPLVADVSDYKNVFYIGTRKAHNDPLSAICGVAGYSDTAKEALTGWEVVTRPISYVPNGDFFTAGEPAFIDENKNAVPSLPTIHDAKSIRSIYNDCVRNPAQGESYFYREYFNLVQAPGDQKFLPAWFDTWIEPAQVPLNTVFSGVAVDSALKDEQILFRGDNMVILIGHVDQYGRLYLTDGARSKAWRTDDFRRNLLAMVAHPKNRQPENFIREKIGEGTLFPLVRGWFNEAKRPMNMHPLKVIGQGKKYLRITEALQGKFMGRKIFFVKGQFPEEMHKVLVDELTHLGQWGHDDVADCLSLFFHPEVAVVPAMQGKKTEWKDVVTIPQQVSTPWTNPMAIRQANPMAPQQDAKTNRLTPFGQDISLDHGTFMVEGAGPKEMPTFEWQPIIQKIGGTP